MKERDAFGAIYGPGLGPEVADEEADLRGDVLEEELTQRPLGGYLPAWTSQLAPQHYHQWHAYKVWTKVATVRSGPRMDSPIVGEIACKTELVAVEEWMVPVGHRADDTDAV